MKSSKYELDPKILEDLEEIKGNNLRKTTKLEKDFCNAVNFWYKIDTVEKLQGFMSVDDINRNLILRQANRFSVSTEDIDRNCKETLGDDNSKTTDFVL